MTIMKLNHQSKKLSEYINESDIILWCPEINCCAHLWAKFMAIITSYPTLKWIKIAITWKTLFREKSTFLGKLDLSEFITWQLFKSLLLRL